MKKPINWTVLKNLDQEDYYYKEKAYLAAEREHQYNLAFQEEFELKIAKIEVKKDDTGEIHSNSKKGLHA